MVITALTCSKLLQWNYMEICGECYPNRKKYCKMWGKFAFTPLNKLCFYRTDFY